MRIRALSDLHLEFFDWTPPPVEADVVVLAGDIHVGVQGLEWAREHFPTTPVVYVAGNHEFYGARLQDVLAALCEAGKRYRPADANVGETPGRNLMIETPDHPSDLMIYHQ